MRDELETELQRRVLETFELFGKAVRNAALDEAAGVARRVCSDECGDETVNTILALKDQTT